MTGEMAWITQEGLDSNGEEWPYHVIIAEAVGGTLKPFDSYQGPYISVGLDLRANGNPVPAYGFGCVRLWLYEDDDGEPVIYREDIDESIACVLEEWSLVECAKEIMTWEKR